MKNLADGVNFSGYVFSQSEENLQDNLIADSVTPFYEDGSNLTITFLSLNRAALSIRLLESIQIYLPDFKGEILIFDNGSDAEELSKLKEFVSKMKFPARIFESGENLGVAGGRNKSAELIETDWFLSLDNDVYFIDNPLSSIKECIDNLGVHFLNLPVLNPDAQTVFAAGGNLSLTEYRDSYAIGCFSSFKPTLKSEIEIEQPFLSTCLFGTAAVLRTKSFINQGGFDAKMFIGFEDLDFSIKLYKEGLKIGNTNKFCAVHGHEAPLNPLDADYEKIRFSKKIIRESGEYFHSKHNVYAWTEDIKNWIESRENNLELKNEQFDFSRRIELHNQNKSRHLQPNLKTGDLPRIALIVDVENWAHHNSAKQLCNELGDLYDIQIFAASSYENPGFLMQDVQDFDLVHFFWRGNLINLFADETRRQFIEENWDYESFIANVVARSNITFSVCDHLFLNENEIKQNEILFNSAAVGYIVISEKLQKIYSSIPDYPHPTRLAENGIALELFVPENTKRLYKEKDEIVIGWAGNSNWNGDGLDRKGLETIIKPAIEELKKAGYKVRGCYADRVEKWLPHDEMKDYYNSVDIYVCASENFEGTPNTVMEAMACGLPVVSTDVGVVPQIFGPLQQDYILPARTIEQLKIKLIELIKSPQKREALSRENLDSIKEWTWKKQSQKWKEFFEIVLTSVQDAPARERRDLLRSQNLRMYLSLNSNQTLIEDLESKVKELQTFSDASQNRIAELDKWTVELQEVIKNSQNRIAELDKWTIELQEALNNSQNRIADLEKWTVELQANLQKANEQVELSQSEIESLQQELAGAQSVLRTVEESRFWKLRNQWFKLKDTLHINGKEK
jgi:glycosyltransferase involved in cell wall biosynthesis